MRHVELARQRPADVRRDPNFTDDRGVRARWKGQFEAEYLGRPPADPGDYWALDRGKLKYVRGDAEVGSVRIYDEAQGILVPDTGKRGSVRFEAGTTKHEAFAILQDQPGFSEWAAACEEFLGVGPDELIARMREPAGETYDRVRHGLKEDLTPQLVGKITERAFLKTRHPELYEGVADPSGRSVQDQIASHRELLRLTKGLGSADRGTIAEQWYAKMYASDAAKRHVRFTGKETEPNLTFGKGERVPDLIDGNQLKDIKHVSGALGKDVETQLADFRKLVDRELNVGGTIYELEHVDRGIHGAEWRAGERGVHGGDARGSRVRVRDLQLARGAEGDRPQRSGWQRIQSDRRCRGAGGRDQGMGTMSATCATRPFRFSLDGPDTRAIADALVRVGWLPAEPPKVRIDYVNHQETVSLVESIDLAQDVVYAKYPVQSRPGSRSAGSFGPARATAGQPAWRSRSPRCWSSWRGSRLRSRRSWTSTRVGKLPQGPERVPDTIIQRRS